MQGNEDPCYYTPFYDTAALLVTELDARTPGVDVLPGTSTASAGTTPPVGAVDVAGRILASLSNAMRG